MGGAGSRRFLLSHTLYQFYSLKSRGILKIIDHCITFFGKLQEYAANKAVQTGKFTSHRSHPRKSETPADSAVYNSGCMGIIGVEMRGYVWNGSDFGRKFVLVKGLWSP